MRNSLLIILIIVHYLPLYTQDIDEFVRQQDSITQAAINKEFPTFTAVSLDGDTITEKDLNEKIVIVNFWFTTCAPCIAEFDALNDLYHRFENHPDFYFLSFTTDHPEDAKETAEKYKLPYKIHSISREEVSRLNFEMGFPTNIILNREGKVLFLKSGGPTDPDKAKKFVEEMEQIIADNLDMHE